MKPKLYKILENCIENGIDFGYMRAHKHVNTPDDIHIKQEIFNAILYELNEYFTFEDLENCCGGYNG